MPKRSPPKKTVLFQKIPVKSKVDHVVAYKARVFKKSSGRERHWAICREQVKRQKRKLVQAEVKLQEAVANMYQGAAEIDSDLDDSVYEALSQDN